MPSKTIPEPWRSFLSDIDERHLLALDPYDLALSKLERNTERDRDDVKHLAPIVPLDLEVLRERYEKDLRPSLGNPEREDLSLELWVQASRDQTTT